MAGPVLSGGGAEALDAAYGVLSDLIVSLDEDQSWRNTRCRGWVVRDLILHLLGDAGPPEAALAVVRTTLDGLLGRPTPPGWSAAEWALVATGRAAPEEEHRVALGADVARLPLLR